MGVSFNHKQNFRFDAFRSGVLEEYLWLTKSNNGMGGRWICATPWIHRRPRSAVIEVRSGADLAGELLPGTPAR